MTDVAIIEDRALTAPEVRQQVNLIQEVLQSVMKPDTHYGVIPGCNQPSLFKPGAEKILSTFRIAVDPEVEDMSTNDEVKYRVKVRGLSMASGSFLGAGIGECSSNEEKYKWKKAVSEAEFEATPEDRRRIKYFKTYTVQQVRTNPADIANTVLKMAKKRGQVDLCLTVTAASDIFTQDIEDNPDLYASTNGNPSGEKKADTVKPGSTGASTSAKKPAPASSGNGLKPQEELKTLLMYYCHGDEDGALALLKELSIYGDPGKENWIKTLGGGTEKWAIRILKELKGKLKKEQDLPADCKFHPEGCNNASLEDGLAYCGPKSCPFQQKVEF